MSDGKNVLVGVSGSIAAYKAAELVSTLRKDGYDVRVVMTPDAERFVSRLTFFSLSGNPVVVDMFEEVRDFNPVHVALGDWADLMIVAPATADIIGKLAAGLANDIVCCTALSTTSPVIVSPAMNNKMYASKAVQANIMKLRELGYEIVEPEEGWLACGTVGKGRLASTSALVRTIKERMGQR